MRIRDLSVVAFSLALVGCSKEAPPAKAPPAHEDHRAPHGGAILELGEEEAHVEVLHDPKAGTLTLYVYGKSLDAPADVEAPTILLAGKELKPTPLAGAGGATASAWTVTDAALATDPLNGRVRVTVAGNTFQSPLEPAGHGG